jgi:hypothetical protein
MSGIWRLTDEFVFSSVVSLKNIRSNICHLVERMGMNRLVLMNNQVFMFIMTTFEILNFLSRFSWHDLIP